MIITMNEIKRILLHQMDTIDAFGRRRYALLPPLLIVSSVIFIFLYTFHTLFRLHRNILLDEPSKVALSEERTTPKVVFWITFMITLVGILLFYQKLPSMSEYMNNLFYLLLLPVLFLFSMIALFLYQKKIMTFADSSDMKRAITAFSIFIFFALFCMYAVERNKVGIHPVMMYLFGYMAVFGIIHLLRLISNAHAFQTKMEQERFGILSKVCLLGKRDTVEESPSTLFEHFGNEGEEDDEDLKYEYEIPVEYYNNKMQKYAPLYIRDFYYMGSFDSCIADGVADLQVLKGNIKDFECRIIHLDVDMDPSGRVVVPSKSSKGESILLEKCLEVLSKDAWSKYGNESLPLFLYLRFIQKDKSDSKIYQKTYESIDYYFGNYLANKLYGFNERNHLFPVSQMPIREALGKVIFMTNVYPTYTVLDEMIHCNVEDPLSSIQMKRFKKEYITYDKQGLLIDYNKDELIKEHRKKMKFYYSESDNGEVFNPSFQEVAKYGGQSALFYTYLPDENIQSTFDFFKSHVRNIALKPVDLRSIEDKSQDEVIQSSASELKGVTETPASLQELISYNPTFG